MAYEAFKFQYNPKNNTPEPLQLFRYCMVTLISIRDSLVPGMRIDQWPEEILVSMLGDLGLVLNRLKKLSFTKDEEKLLLFKKRLIAAIPKATSALGSGIPFRKRYEMHINNPDTQELAQKALQACLEACQECSKALDSILGESTYLPILKRFGLDE